MIKHVIEVKDGRAYLHWETKIGKLKHIGTQPLGSDPDFIKRIKDQFRCKVVFLD